MWNKIILISIGLLISCSATKITTKYTPFVVMHGIAGDSATVQHVADLVQKIFPGIYVKNIEIGDGKDASIFTGMNIQVADFCDQIWNDPQLRDGFNLMGTSQGGMIARGFLERCGSEYRNFKSDRPLVRNFISWVSPQGGQWGVPRWGEWGEVVAAMVDCCAYNPYVQDFCAPAGYWRDPYQYNTFVYNSSFLSDIDNLKPNKNKMYKNNILALDSFVMGYSTVDVVLVPKETGWFGFFEEGNVDVIVPLEKTDFYKSDYIGLRALDEQGKLHRFKTDCIHEDYSSPCFDRYFFASVVPHLNNTISVRQQ